eukprot:3625667-Amphidinium_carterae.4
MVVGALPPKEFDVIAVAFVVLEDATGMAIGEKSKILLVGRAPLEVHRSVAQSDCTRSHFCCVPGGTGQKVAWSVDCTRGALQFTCLHVSANVVKVRGAG